MFLHQHKNKLIHNLLIVSFLSILSFIGYQNNMMFYLVLFLYIPFVAIKHFTYSIQLLVLASLLLLNNFIYLILPNQFTLVEEIGLVKFIINNTSIAAINLFLICSIFYCYFIMLKKRYPELIDILFSSKFQNIINIITLIILIISEYIVFEIYLKVSVSKLCIFTYSIFVFAYSILISFILIKTFPKGIASIINTAFIVLVLVSPLVTLFFYLILRVYYVPHGRFFFLSEFFPYIYFSIALVCTSIITVLPQRYFAAQMRKNKLKFFVLFCLMLFLVNLKNIPAFQPFFDK